MAFPLSPLFSINPPQKSIKNCQLSSHGVKPTSQSLRNHPPPPRIQPRFNSDPQNEKAQVLQSSSRLSSIIDKLQTSLQEDGRRRIAEATAPPSIPRETRNCSDGRSGTELAEKMVPEPELRRLRGVALRMRERVEVGAVGVTEAVVVGIRERWREAEVVKLKFQDSAGMTRVQEDLERKTGGLVIWKCGSSLVLYRGIVYGLPCVQSNSQIASIGSSCKNILLADCSRQETRDRTNGLAQVSTSPDDNATSLRSESPTGTSDIDSLLDQLGSRYEDWSDSNQLPVDADLLPGVVSGYKPPFRLLPYKTRICLRNKEMTSLRRLAKRVPPHFALGRNMQHQGLATSIVKLWEKSAIAKIAVKRGVSDTCNERMAEEIKKLTGGVILSRNKEYIILYRGNDFLKPPIRDALVEKENLATSRQDDEEVARLRASVSVVSNTKSAKGPLVAGTLAETKAAFAHWANQPSSEDREKMKRDIALANHASHVRFLERKLSFAQEKVRKAEEALAKVQKFLQPVELPTDLETITDEERVLFRKIGLKMRAYLLLGRRDVFDGTIQNMHLNWKYREVVKIFVKGKKFAQVKHIAISLEAESGGLLISLDKTTKGYAIIIYRGKNYRRPSILRPTNLLTKRQALARSIELQRREALNYHVSSLKKQIWKLNQLNQMKADRKQGNMDLDMEFGHTLLSDADVEWADTNEIQEDNEYQRKIKGNLAKEE